MSDISNTLMKLQLTENIFKEIKFFVSGEVHEKIVELLKCGGAERLNYFSDYVTHLIVGENPEENDIADAQDVYEIPALTPKWVLMSAALKRQVHIKPYLYFPGGKLFSNLVFCFSSIREDLNVLWSLITYNGGIVQLNLNRKCDYLVTTNLVGTKYEKAESLGSDFIKIVTPDWIVEAVKNNSYPDFSLFHPKLIDWPKPFKHESTTAITGFEPEQLASEEDQEEKIISDSTQALLEKLKQRMPWNQPSTPLITSSSDPVAPPNVVAPSFKSAHLPNPVPRGQPQQTVPQPQPQTQVAPQSPVSSNLPLIPRSLSTTLTNQQTPKSIIHHTPTPTSNFQQQHNQHNPLNISRLIGQPQARSNLQLRGQPVQSQLHQQLLHQQNQSNIIQRTTSGQIPIPQQLLQQQLQRQLAQRQLLQNQLNQNQLLQQQQASTNQQQVIQDQQHIGPNQHIAQLSKQQLNQLQQQQLQLKQNQQLQITQNQQQLSLNQGHQIQIGQSQQQVPVTQNQQQVQMNPNPQQIQISQTQQQIQISQGQQQTEISQNQQQIQSNQNQQQIQSNQNQQQIQLNQNQQPIQLNSNQQQVQLNQNQQQIQLNQNQQQIQMNQNQQTQNQQQIQLSSSQQHIQLNSKQQQIQLNSNQQQIQLNSNQQQIQLNSSQQQIQLTSNQQQIQLNSNQQQIQLNPNQQQIQLNQSQQQLQLNQNQHIQQAQSQIQLNQSQHIQLNKNQVQNQQQLLQNQVMQPQNQIIQQGSQQIQMSQGQTFIQQTMNQLISQQNQQILQQKQQFLSQQQAATSQQQTLHNQPNLAVQQQQFVSSSFSQNQDINQRSISQQGLNQVINQQNLNHQNLNVQVLNQQLSTQNLGQQLNQQQLNQQQLNQQINPQVQHNQLGQQIGQQEQLDQRLGQQNQLNQQQIGQQAQLNQQSQISQQLTQQNQLNQQIVHQSQLNQQNQFNQQQINQQNQLNDQTLEQGLGQTMQVLNQQLNQGINQQLQQQLNRQTIQQQQQQMTQQQLQQQGLNQQNLQQLNQVNSSLPQQVVRSQFQQQPNIGQQILINQASPQNSSPQRTQLNQHLWAQSAPQVPAQQIIRHPVNIIQQGSPRVQWSPNAQQGAAVTQRQFIQLDARTHQELQKMPPEQQAIFVAKIQRHRQFLKQVQQRGGGGSHILIRGNVPPGLTTQQQVQWLQQQAKQQGIVLPPNIQQQNITPGTLTQPGLTQTIQHAPGLSPINQSPTQFTDQNLQIRQFRLQQLQLQREQAQKNHLAQQQGAIQQPTVVRPIGQSQLADSTTNPTQLQDANIQHSLVVNAKTKTALANMLSIKLQSGGSSVGGPRPETIQEPSAAGTLRLMTAQHNAALNSKPQEIIALQRRTINGPNGEIIKPPGAQQLPTTPTNEPPKLQYCPKPSLPLQHRPGPFYGHNPNLKLPPDLFLLGCIFVVVEVDNFLEESMPGWQQKIEKHGGEVEKQYCSRVTHVLCETQRHGVVMQALRDCKRCVTIFWLNDVLTRKQVLPPWTALHLPNIYLDTAPAAKHLMSFSGFEGNDRNRIKQMIKNTGANFTSYFSKHNTVLITTKGDCKKCAYAKKWQIPVVNVQWLTDVMLGHFSAMNQMEHQIYQQFSNPSNFSFDPKLVPNLMVAWKAPINISQESYERVKRSASPVVLPKKTKIPKIEPTDENDNVSEEHYRNSTHKIMFSMFNDTKQMEKMVRDLGGSIAKNEQDFTHLIMPQLARSNKLFYAIARGCKVVSDRWLKDSHATNQFLPENDYSLDSKEFNYDFNCNIEQTFLKRNRNKIFEGKFFFVTPSVFPCKRVVVELVQCCGGIVERRRRSSAQIEATSINSPYSYFIVTHEDDLHLVGDLLKNKKDKMKIVCNAELIFSAILKQTFEVEPYAVCVL